MRALHVFPLFDPGLTNGSEYQSYMLTKKLIEQGVSVDLFATRSAELRFNSAFAVQWRSDFHREYERVDDINVHRFPVTLSLPSVVSHKVSTLILDRWKTEEIAHGVMLKGSKHLEEYYYRRALSRPALYEWLFLLGLGPWSWPLIRQLARDIRKYDIILTGFVPLALPWQVMTLARRWNKPIVLLPLFHPDDLYHHHRVFYQCFANASAILAQTAYSADLFKRLVPSSRPVQVGAGVDFKSFSAPSISGARFRSRYGLTDQKLVLFVGRKEQGKRYDLAIQAVDMLNDQRVRLVMIGSDVDRKPLHSTNILYLGNISRESRQDLIDAYDACDVFVMPSEHESFGMVFLEAWMRKKPVIGNAFCRPVASLVVDGQDGYVCRSAQEIANRIRQLLADPELAGHLGERGYRKVVRDYTWDVIGKKVATLYHQLVDQSHLS